MPHRRRGERHPRLDRQPAVDGLDPLRDRWPGISSRCRRSARSAAREAWLCSSGGLVSSVTLTGTPSPKAWIAFTLPQMCAAPALIARSNMLATLTGGVMLAPGRAEDLRVLDPPLDLDPVLFRPSARGNCELRAPQNPISEA